MNVNHSVKRKVSPEQYQKEWEDAKTKYVRAGWSDFHAGEFAYTELSQTVEEVSQSNPDKSR